MVAPPSLAHTVHVQVLPPFASLDPPRLQKTKRSCRRRTVKAINTMQSRLRIPRLRPRHLHMCTLFMSRSWSTFAKLDPPRLQKMKRKMNRKKSHKWRLNLEHLVLMFGGTHTHSDLETPGGKYEEEEPHLR